MRREQSQNRKKQIVIEGQKERVRMKQIVMEERYPDRKIRLYEV